MVRATHFTPEMNRLVVNTDALFKLLEEEKRERRKKLALELFGDIGNREDRQAFADFLPRDLWLDARLLDIRMTVAPATANTDNMASVTGNTSGAIQTLLSSNLWGARQRKQFGRIVLASQDYDQTGGLVFGIARLPLYSVLSDIDAMTDTSLGSSTLAFGDAGSGNSAIYGAAATLTSTQTKTRVGPPVAQYGLQINTGFDSVSGNQITPFMPQAVGQGGALYEDVTMTVGVADLPSSGNLVLATSYQLD